MAPIPLTPDAGLGQGVFSVDRDLGSGYVQQWNASVQREITPNISVEVAYVGSKITRVGIPDTNLNQLTVEQLSQGSALLQRVPNPFFGTIPRSSSLGDPTIPVAQLLKPYPAVHDRQSLPQQRRDDELQRCLRQGGAALLARLVVSRELHPLEAARRCLVGVRRVDSDRAGCQLPGRRQFQSPARTRLLDGRHSACLCRLGGVGYSVRRQSLASSVRRARSRRERLDADRARDAAVGRPACCHAVDQQQRVRGIRDAASEYGRRPRAALR